MKQVIFLAWLVVANCLVACQTDNKNSPTPDPQSATEPPLKVEVNFNADNWNPLLYASGPSDNPAEANPDYKAAVQNRQVVYSIPQATRRPKLSGFLDLPTANVPIAGDLMYEWTFTNVAQLLVLGNSAGSLAIAGCYVRGAIAGGTADWSNGDNFGGFWFGFVKTTDGQRLSAIRSGNGQITSEPFAATNSVSYRIIKKGTTLQLFRKYDAATDWTKVGNDLTISIRAGGSSAVAITHVRVLNNSDEAASVAADDFRWYY